MPFLSALQTGGILHPLSGRCMPVFILDKGHFLLVDQIRGVIILSIRVFVEEPHTLLHVVGIVLSPHGVVVGKIILEKSILTMVRSTEHHFSHNIGTDQSF